jgi:acetylcholinesterase
MTTSQANQIPNLYPLEPPLPEHEAWFPSASRAYAETTFICPTNTILNAMLNATTNSSTASNSSATATATATSSSQPNTGIWSYRYNVHDDWNTARGLGVPHVYESTAVFGPGNLGMGPSNRAYCTYNAPIVPVVMNYWLSFARTLDPNVYKDPSAPEWQQWSADQTRLVFQTNASVMERVDHGQIRRCQFWKDAAQAMEQ